MRKKSNYGWVMAALAFVVLFIGSYVQYQLSPLAYLIIPEFGLSNSQFSSVFSAPMIPGLCLSLVAGLLCDKYGVKKCITVALTIAVAGIVLRTFSSSYTTLFICMILAGLASTFISSNIAKYLGGWFAPEKIGTMIGITMAGSTAAMAIGMGTTAMFPSVRAAYIFAAVLAVIILVAWFLLARKSEAEKADKKAEIKEQQISIIDCLKGIIKNKHIWLIGSCLMFLMGSQIALSAFLPMALQAERGIAATASGVVTSVIMFGNLAGTILGPILCAKIGRMKPYLLVCGVIAAIGVVFAWQLPTGIIMTVAMFVTGFFASAMIPTLMSLPIMLPGVGPGLAGTAGGLVSTVQLFGCVVIPTYIIAPIAGDSYRMIMILAGICGLLSAVCVLGIPDLFRKESK